MIDAASRCCETESLMTDTPSAEDAAAPAPTPAPAVGDIVTVEVGNPVAGGQCIARLDGRVIFVRDGIPGELVKVVVTGSGKRGAFLRGDVCEVLDPSPHRVQPPCSLADECGGCDWQHVDLAFQRELKAQVIADALRRTGGIEDIADQPLATSTAVRALDDGDGLHWRTRMRYAIDENGVVGLRAARSHRIIAAADCPLAVTQISSAVPPTVAQTGNGREALIAAYSSTGELALVGVNADSVITERVRERDFRVAANGFWQVHPQAPETLVSTVLEFASPQHGEKILDLYSGVGLFAAFLAEAVGVTGRVDAVEADRTASDLARKNLADLAWVHHHRAPVEKWLAAGHRSHADIVVLDPPRTGAGRDVVTAVSRRKPRALVYVACDPVSLARDTKFLAALGYQITKLRALDLFPMTKHVESVALFERS